MHGRLSSFKYYISATTKKQKKKKSNDNTNTATYCYYNYTTCQNIRDRLFSYYEIK